MFYRFVRAVVSFALSLFYRLEVVRKVEDLSGPVMFVGNHPNSLIDPALVFVMTNRQVTFLAKEPLFRAPVFGWVLRGLGALPVYRKQDHPGQTAKNEGTLEAAAQALMDQKAITIFPEGKSHSEPQLSDIKTGAARIALRVAHAGSALRVIPIGFTYQQKNRFKSRVLVEVGDPILVQAVGALDEAAEVDWVKRLTQQIGDGMRAVTLNLESWEDLEIVETADQLFALRNGYREKDPERLRMMARGAALVRNEQPERFDEIKEDLMSFRTRLEMVSANPQDLSVEYRKREVAYFALRNLAAIFFGFPLFAIGVVLFAFPFLLLRVFSRVIPVSRDRIATLKFISALVMVPLWWIALTVAAWYFTGVVGMVLTLIFVLPLAMYTRYFLERRRAAVEDVFTFLRLGNRSRLRQRLLFEGERLQEEVQQIIVEFKAKVEQAPAQL